MSLVQMALGLLGLGRAIFLPMYNPAYHLYPTAELSQVHQESSTATIVSVMPGMTGSVHDITAPAHYGQEVPVDADHIITVTISTSDYSAPDTSKEANTSELSTVSSTPVIATSISTVFYNLAVIFLIVSVLCNLALIFLMVLLGISMLVTSIYRIAIIRASTRYAYVDGQQFGNHHWLGHVWLNLQERQNAILLWVLLLAALPACHIANRAVVLWILLLAALPACRIAKRYKTSIEGFVEVVRGNTLILCRVSSWIRVNSQTLANMQKTDLNHETTLGEHGTNLIEHRGTLKGYADRITQAEKNMMHTDFDLRDLSRNVEALSQAMNRHTTTLQEHEQYHTWHQDGINAHSSLITELDDSLGVCVKKVEEYYSYFTTGNAVAISFKRQLDSFSKHFFYRLKKVESKGVLHDKEILELRETLNRERAEKQEVIKFLRQCTPGNMHTNEAYQRMIADVPEGRLAPLLVAFMTAMNTQAGITNENIHRLSVQAPRLPGLFNPSPASRTGPTQQAPRPETTTPSPGPGLSGSRWSTPVPSAPRSGGGSIPPHLRMK